MKNRELAVEIKNVKKSFKNLHAVKGVNLQIYKGEFLALLGPNGAGKTTLVEMIEGIQTPDSGEIFITGKKWKGNELELHHSLGISLQETRFIDRLTARETLLLFASFYRLDGRRVDEVLGMINLYEKRNAFVNHLSGGQRQRLALGISLLNSPEILLLDEPTTGLDPISRRELWEILLYLKKYHGTSLILTTHYMEEAEYLCDRIVIMNQGEVLAMGTLEELLRNNNLEEYIEFSLKNEITNFDFLPKNIFRNFKFDAKQRKGNCYISNAVQDLPVFFEIMKQQHIELTFVQCRKLTLDDLFLVLTGKKLEEN